MIAGQHAQAAGKNGKALGQAELRGKIGYERGPAGWMNASKPVERGLTSASKSRDAFEMSHERIVGRRFLQASLVDGPSLRTGLWPHVSQRSLSRRRNKAIVS